MPTRQGIYSQKQSFQNRRNDSPSKYTGRTTENTQSNLELFPNQLLILNQHDNDSHVSISGNVFNGTTTILVNSKQFMGSQHGQKRSVPNRRQSTEFMNRIKNFQSMKETKISMLKKKIEEDVSQACTFQPVTNVHLEKGRKEKSRKEQHSTNQANPIPQNIIINIEDQFCLNLPESAPKETDITNNHTHTYSQAYTANTGKSHVLQKARSTDQFFQDQILHDLRK